MNESTQQFLVQIIGPSGVVKVHGKRQQFVEEAPNRQVLEKSLTAQKLDIDPVMGSRLLPGRYLGCWVHIQALPDPQGTLDLDKSTEDTSSSEP